MRVTFQPFLVLALGLVAAQDIAGHSARGLEQVDDSQHIAGRSLQGVDSKLIEAREPKKPQSTPKKETSRPAAPAAPTSKTTPPAATTTARVVTTTSSQKTTSTSSVKSSSTKSQSSSVSSTATKVTSTSSSSETSSTASSSSSASGTATGSVTSSTASITGTGTQTSTGTETGTATTSTSTAIQTPSRKWCDNGGSCKGNSCEAPIKHGSNSTSSKARRSYPVSLPKRAFVDPVANWEGLEDIGGADLSQYFSSDFFDFEADPLSIYIDGLIGCTAIGVFSKEGMQAVHLWETPSHDKTGKLTRDPVETLWPAKDKEFVKATLAKAKRELSRNKAKFAGGELVIMLPMQGSDYLYEVDETYKWTDKTPGGAISKAPHGRMDLQAGLVKQGRGVVDMIKTMAKEATGITTVKECTYVPNADDETAGRFVVQYDPKSAGKKKAVQVWCESETQYSSGYTW